MGAELIKTSYLIGLETGGRNNTQALRLEAHSGDNLFLQGSPRQREGHFSVLCGLRDPDMGVIFVDGQALYTLSSEERVRFRQDKIGGIPAGGGLIPEISMLEQILLPLLLKGTDRDEALDRLNALLPSRMSLASLSAPPRKSPGWKQAYACVLRVLLQQPKVLILDGLMEELDELDADELWRLLLEKRPRGSVLIYLSGAPAPQQVRWDRSIRL